MKLTKDADSLMCVIYKAYLQRVKDGSAKLDARDFSSNFGSEVNAKLKWSDGDYDATFSELVDNGLVKPDILGNFELTVEAVVYMENRFPDGLKQVVEALSTLSGIVSGAYGAFKG